MFEKLYSEIIHKLQNKEISKAIAADLIKACQASNIVGVQNDDIAIIGMACRFPQANSLEEFWHNLKNGIDSVGAFPKSRRIDIDPYIRLIDATTLKSKDPYFHGGYLDEIDKFDAEVFNILPGEAIYIDPQQRMFAELVLEACEDAGYGWRKIKNSNTGVYVGNTGNKYGYFFDKPIPSLAAGNWPAFVASRISYIFDLSGPSMMVSVGCASSLLAVHLACQALLTGDCNMALAGGINLDLAPLNTTGDIWNLLGIYEDNVKCKAFDDSASGIAKGEGGGVVLLKKHHQALQDGDNIYAVIKASVANQDGHSNGITAPNAIAQAKMLKLAWKKAKIDPRTISYIEAHGTGTKIGDPIELKGMCLAFNEFTNDKHFCAIGSSKTNIGHLADGGAGVAGLIKTVLSLKYKQIPASLHFKVPNRFINFKDAPVYVNDKLSDWQPIKGVRRAGISAFGLCGTNVHIILEEAKANIKIVKNKVVGTNIFCLAAANISSLYHTIKKYQRYVDEHDFNIVDFCFTVNISRTYGQHRVAIVFSDQQDLLAKFVLITNIDTFQAQNGANSIYYAMVNQEQKWIGFEVEDDIYKLAHEYVHGMEVDWEKFYSRYKCVKLSLPTYAFNRKRYWPETNLSALPPLLPFTKIKAASDQEVNRQILVESTITKQFCPLDDNSLLKIWTEVLGKDDFDQDTDFFALGGDSLLAVDLIDKIQKKLGLEISYELFFFHTSFNAFKDFILSQQKVAHHEGMKIVPVCHQDFYQVSFAQKRLWVLQQIQKENVAYNISAMFQFKGSLNTKLFINAFELVMSHHESFKTSFILYHDQLQQKIDEDISLKIEVFDYQDLETGYDEAIKLFNTAAGSSFILEKTPLIKCFFFKIKEDVNLFGYIIHHIIFDGRSNRILFDQVVETYNNLIHNATPKLLPTIVNYKDFAQWQNDYLQTNEQDVGYWRQKFVTPFPITEIPGDKIRPKVFTFKGDILKFKIDKKLADKFSELCKTEEASLFMGLVALIDMLIYRYSGISDIIIGSPVAGRLFAELQHVIGNFVNTIPLRMQVEKEYDFNQLLAEVKQQALEAYSHQNYPFDLLVEQLNLAKDTSRSPLFNINVALQSSFSRGEKIKVIDGVEVSLVKLKHQSAKWDLAFDFIEEDSGISAYVEYYSDLYTAEFIGHLVENLVTLLRSIVNSPKQKLNQYDLLSKNNIQKVLSLTAGMACHLEENKTVVDMFESVVHAHPNDIAVRHDEKEYSYQELNIYANRIANWLNSKSKVKLVGIYLDNTYEAIGSILGVLKAGSAYLPLDVNCPVPRVVDIINNSRVTLLLSKSKHIKNLNRLLWECKGLNEFICLDSENVLQETEQETNELMNEELWNYVSEKARNEIEGGGWVSSYTGENFSAEEMQEYSKNISDKLQAYINPRCRVLEIGCASGITMFTLAPKVGYYVGTDISAATLAVNREKIRKNNIENIKLIKVDAYHIDQIEESNIDIVILNSVIHCFNGHNYLNQVLHKVIAKLKDKGIIFIGDVMDLDKKADLCSSLMAFKKANCNHPKYVTKISWDTELFLPQSFFVDFASGLSAIINLKFSEKIHSIENELTKFRYDLIIEVDKNSNLEKNTYQKLKYQYGKDLLQHYDSNNLGLEIKNNDLAYVLHTSGSTGKPKGVMIPHNSLMNYITWAAKQYLDQDDKEVSLFTPLIFDLTVTSIFCALLYGKTSIIYNGGFEEIYSKLFSNGNGTLIKLTPSHLDFLLKSGHQLFPYTKYILGGEALTLDLLLRLKSKQTSLFTIFNEYGPTEATVGCIMHQISESDITNSLRILIGKPIFNTRVLVLNDLQQLQPIGAVGEIYLAGMCLANGYLNDGDATHERFILAHVPGISNIGNLYKTGDLGRYLFDGNIEYLGRVDNQIKIRGYRIEQNEIQAALKDIPGVIDAIISVKKIDNDDKICAYYLSQNELKNDALMGRLREILPKYMLPHFIMRLSAFPITVNGKLDTAALPCPNAENIQKNSKYIKPQNEIQKKIAAIWEKILNVSQIGIRDNFFELGGDSIKAIQMIAELTKVGYKASVQNIFEHSTIEGLATSVQTTVLFVDQGAVIGKLRLTPIQFWFFDHIKHQPNYYNNAITLRFCNSVDEKKLSLSLEHLSRHHDILRAYFYDQENSLWLENIDNFPYPETFFVKDLSACNFSEEVLINEINKIQSSITLSKPPLWKTVLFKFNAHDILLIVVHHLLIDGISWRILIEDLGCTYQQLCQNEEVGLLPKTTSYRTWSDKLIQYAATNQFKEELNYWVKQLNKPYGVMHCNQSGKLNLVQDAKIIKFQLSDEDTNLLLFRTVQVFNVNVQDILLTALALTLRDYHGSPYSLIILEKHGRTEIFQDIDISRTVGWFTSVFPFILVAEPDDSAGQCIIKNKENIRHLPAEGIGYGVMKYLANLDYPQIFNLRPQFMFNYLGTFGEDHSGKFFTIDYTNVGKVKADKQERPYEFEIGAMIVNKRLELLIEYNYALYDDTMVQELGKDYINKIRELIAYCTTHEGSEITPSDLTYNELTIEELNNIF